MDGLRYGRHSLSQTAAQLLGNRHLQTLMGNWLRPRGNPWRDRERIALSDGDFVDLDRGQPAAPDAPVALVLHGLEGSSSSGYVRLVAAALQSRGALVYGLNFRSCSGEPNRQPRLYHSGDTGDLAVVLDLLRARHSGRPLGAVGFSLGGNVLLKYLGETGGSALVDRAAAVSVPFELGPCADALAAGVSRMYGRTLLRSLQAKVKVRQTALRDHCDVERGLRATTFRQFDDAVTGPLHGFQSAEDYFNRSSSRRFISQIRTPTTILHAADDPFVPGHTIPYAEARASGAVDLRVSPTGGHVGFIVDAPWKGAAAFAIEAAAARFLVP